MVGAVFILGLVIFLALPNGENTHETTEAKVVAAFNQAVDTHPQKEIREGLRQLLTSKKVGLSYVSYLPDDVSDNFVLAVGEGVRENGDVVPTLILTPAFLSDPIGLQWSDLMHEYVHLLKALENGFDENPMTKHKAQVMYEEEVLAYTFQCIFETDMAINPYSSICKGFETIGEQEFRLAVAEHLTNTEGDPRLQRYREAIVDLARKTH